MTVTPHTIVFKRRLDFQTKLSDPEFKEFSAIIHETCGIKLPPVKKTMLSARLHKRLRFLGISSFADYLDYILSYEGQHEELAHMIDAVSTNKTEFFREANHFDFLTSHLLPEYVEKFQKKPGRQLRVWSAGCSSGEEPYTLAMVLDDFFSRHPGMNFSILATDICTKVLAKAEQAIYPKETIANMPARFRHKYLLRGKDRQKGFHRVGPELRRKVTFRRLNFMARDFGIDNRMDIIFCRNVLIYFDRKTQIDLFKKLHKQLASGGYLFLGHSETLHGINDKVNKVEVAVYKCR